MNKLLFVTEVGSKLKLIRTEYGYPQEKMANILGISKKTLIEIEKGRANLSWSTAVCICTLFSKSEILSTSFGGHLHELILTLAFDDKKPKKNNPVNPNVYWKTVGKDGEFRIQKNAITPLYRIVGENSNRTIFSSFDIERIKQEILYLRNLSNDEAIEF